jgi:hypothetical protein
MLTMRDNGNNHGMQRMDIIVMLSGLAVGYFWAGPYFLAALKMIGF